MVPVTSNKTIDIDTNFRKYCFFDVMCLNSSHRVEFEIDQNDAVYAQKSCRVLYQKGCIHFENIVELFLWRSELLDELLCFNRRFWPSNHSASV